MPAYYTEIIVVGLGLILLLAEAFLPKISYRFIANISILALLGVFGSLFFVGEVNTDSSFWSFYTDDRLALFYKGFALLSTIGFFVIANEYAPVLSGYVAKGKRPPISEYFVIPLFACAGLMWMASAIDLTSIFVSLEIVTISSYIMVSYMRRNVGSLEAGTKYLILGALSTGFFVFGLAWLYGATGKTNLYEIQMALQTLGAENSKIVLFSFALLLVGLGFKIGVFPFHIWLPDVYQGAPTPTTAFLSTASKAGGAIVLSRLLEPYLHLGTQSEGVASKVSLIIAILAGCTIVYGYLSAIPQTNFKRLLSYSSIASAGAIFMALACSFTESYHIPSASAVAYYLSSNLPGIIACFLGIAVVRTHLGGEEISLLNGLGKRSPLVAFGILCGLASLAGIPPFGGFWGKLTLLWLGIDQKHWILVTLLILGTAASFYFYFNVIKAMYWNNKGDSKEIRITLLTRVAFIVLIALTLLFWLIPVYKFLNVNASIHMAELAKDLALGR